MIKTPATPILPFRPTTGDDLNWARDLALAAAEILKANIEGREADPIEIMTEADAWLTADDTGDYASAACGMIAFLRPYLTEAYGHARMMTWTLGAIRACFQDFLTWEDSDRALVMSYEDYAPYLPQDIADFYQDITTAGCGDWTGALKN